MPGRPLVPRDNIYSRGADQMCRQDSRVHLSEEEERAAEESLSIYCKPVELYNILRCRAISSPSFLQRCLRYNQQAKNKHRIQMTISLSGTANNGLETQNLFPIYVMLARSLSDVAVAEPAVYHVSRVRLLTSNLGVEEVNHRSQVTFILPELKKLSEEVVKTSSILLVGGADISTLLCGDDLTINHTDMASCQLNIGRYGLWGNISLELFASWDTSSLSRERVEMLTTVDMRSCFVKTSSSDNKKSISFQTTKSISLQVPVNISAEEVGAKDKTPYDSCLYNDIPSSSLSNDVGGLRNGNVIFNYRYYNNKLQRTEVTSDFTCPFCLVKCASYKGLRLHLPSSHDLFNFEFRVNEEYQAVNVSVNTDQWSSEVVADGVDPKQQTFFFCAKPPNRRYPKSLLQKAKHVRPLVLDSNLPAATTEQHWGKINGCSSAAASFAADPEYAQSASGSNIAPPAMLTFAKTRKLSAQGSDSRNRTLLQKRQFFHSHRAQPMALQQVFSDRDSEDEVDDDVADFEDRRMLDDFVDVTKDEKQMMHLWNSFVRKQRVLADGHIPWACESFSKLHGEELVLAPALLRCWRLFMVKLWNHGLLDARTMDKCNVILEQFGSQDSDLMRS